MQIQSSSSLEQRIREKYKTASFWNLQKLGKSLKSITDGGMKTQAKSNKIFKCKKSRYDIWLTILNYEWYHCSASSFLYCPGNNIQNCWHELQDYTLFTLCLPNSIVAHIFLAIEFLLVSQTLYKSVSNIPYFLYQKYYPYPFMFDSG